LARRVRRNLSDKSVRKAVKHSHLSPTKGYKKNVFSLYLRITLYITLLFLVVFFSYKFLSSLDFDSFFRQSTSEESIGENLPDLTELNDSPANRNENIASEKGEINRTEPIQPVKQKLQLEILNGCGADGVASRATEYCRQKGLDVVYNGNFKNYGVSESYIIGWIENQSELENIAKIMGIEASKISLQKNNNKQLAASIILGADYQKLNPFQN
jgi:hypothetical protein